MNSEKKVAETIQQTREWARAEYQTKTKGLIFTKDFQTRQEALMRDPLATVGERVMAWILRRSWGEYVLYAIKDDGEPAFQRDCAKQLGIDKAVVSRAVAYLQGRGYLEDRPKLLYPVIAPVLGAPPKKDKKLTRYATFYEDWKVTHAVNFQAYEVANAVIKNHWKVVHADYKKFLKQAQKTEASGGASLLNSKPKTVQRIFETEPSSSAFSVSPPEVQKAEEESLYQKFKSQYPADHYDEAKAKPSFDGKTPAQQAHVLERLALYLTCDRWKDEDGRWIPLASNWLKTYEADPDPLLKKNGASSKKGFTESVLEEAKRRFDKYGRV